MRVREALSQAIRIFEHDHCQDCAYDQHPRYPLGPIALEKSGVHIVPEDRGHKEDREEDHGQPCELLNLMAVDFQGFFQETLHTGLTFLI